MVIYTYADAPNWSDDLAYREKVVARYFGDKPTIYPPIPPGIDGQTFDL